MFSRRTSVVALLATQAIGLGMSSSSQDIKHHADPDKLRNKMAKMETKQGESTVRAPV